MQAPMLTNEIILAAIDGYEAQKTRIDEKNLRTPGHAGWYIGRGDRRAHQREAKEDERRWTEGDFRSHKKALGSFPCGEESRKCRTNSPGQDQGEGVR